MLASPNCGRMFDVDDGWFSPNRGVFYLSVHGPVNEVSEVEVIDVRRASACGCDRVHTRGIGHLRLSRCSSGSTEGFGECVVGGWVAGADGAIDGSTADVRVQESCPTGNVPTDSEKGNSSDASAPAEIPITSANTASRHVLNPLALNTSVPPEV